MTTPESTSMIDENKKQSDSSKTLAKMRKSKILMIQMEIEDDYLFDSNEIKTAPYKLGDIVFFPLEPWQNVSKMLRGLKIPFEIKNRWCFTDKIDSTRNHPKKAEREEIKCCVYSLPEGMIKNANTKEDLLNLWNRFCDEEFKTIFHWCNCKIKDGDRYGDLSCLLYVQVLFDKDKTCIEFDSATLVETYGHGGKIFIKERKKLIRL